MSTKRRTEGVHASPAPKNEKGEKLCRNCKAPLPKGRKYHNCSPKCSEEWALKTSPSLMRRAVEKRDKGVCAECKTDTRAKEVEYWHKRKLIGMTQELERKALKAEYGPLMEWEADHIVPVIEGGGECGLEGFRTLCIACHRKATKELRGRMSRRRRDEKALERDRQGLFADQLEGM